MEMVDKVSHDSPGDQREFLARTRRILHRARSVFVLTGAGISAESGVPTYRGADGLWSRDEALSRRETFALQPEYVWRMVGELRRRLSACKPNAAHRALADFAASPKRGVTVLTQNVDGLHERARQRNLLCLHGSLWRNRCLDCGTEREDAATDFEELPASPCCGALERPAVVWFGEAEPRAEKRRAEFAFKQAEALLIVGTSLQVMRAAFWVMRANMEGVPVIAVDPAGCPLAPQNCLRLPAATALPLLLDP